MPAAAHGRVETLFVAVGVQRWGAFDPSTGSVTQHEMRQAGDEDLLDLAAISTMINGGTVYALAPDDLPGESRAAAIQRY